MGRLDFGILYTVAERLDYQITQSPNHSMTPSCNLVSVAPWPGIAANCWPSAEFASCCDRINVRLCFIILKDVFFANVGRGKNGNEGRGGSGFFNVRASFRFFPLDQAHHANDLESEFAGGFDGLNGRGARGADIVDNNDSRAFFSKAFDTLASAVLLLGFAYQKAAEITAEHRDRNHDRISSHGQAADGLRLPSTLANFLEKNFPGEARALGIKGRGAAIDVVVARASGREFEVSQAEGFEGQRGKQVLTRRVHENLRYHEAEDVPSIPATAGAKRAGMLLWGRESLRREAAPLSVNLGANPLFAGLDACYPE